MTLSYQTSLLLDRNSHHQTYVARVDVIKIRETEDLNIDEWKNIDGWREESETKEGRYVFFSSIGVCNHSNRLAG